MSLTVVPISKSERATGTPSQETINAAYEAIYEQGVVVLRGVFPVTGIDGLYQEFSTRYGGLDRAGMQAVSQKPPPNPIQNVGDGRFEIAPRLSGLFGQPGLLANPIVTHLVGPPLGGALMRLSGVTIVASFPGSGRQHIHRDHPQLFFEYPEIGPALPLYAMNVSVPLIDIDAVTGPTGIWPGSHRWQEQVQPKPEEVVTIPFQRGDCILMDYRTHHVGLPNNGTKVRPILYLVYAREWFFDDNNHRYRAPLDISLEELQRLPPELQILMMRAYQQALRARQMNRH